LSFHNLWPTPWITTRHELSVEIAGLVLLLSLAGELGHWPSRRALRWLAVLVALFALARYMEVTSPSLYGRGINLYWDAQHLPQVLAMLADVLPTWQVWLLGAGVPALLVGLYLAARGVLALLVDRLTDAPLRRATLALSGTLLAVYTVGLMHPQIYTSRWFSLPVSTTYAKQLRFVYQAVAGDATLDTAANPLPLSNLALLGRADVLLLFFESYGAATLDRSDFARQLAETRQRLTRSIVENGKQVVSTRVRSPTFGGASWLAHSTFLSGIEIADNHRYQLLLTQQVDTLIQRFATLGYRTVGVMPGLKRAWPEGAFYGYDKVYDAAALDYSGPAFGWWRIPDQYALARLDALELKARRGAPLLAVMTTISSHAPFRPVPPYQADWQALLDVKPYATAAQRAHDADSTTMTEDYLEAINYVLTYVAGYVAQRSRDDLVLILIGDHQPPARVSGPEASWDVPVHVITGNAGVIGALQAEGFVPGLTPRASTSGPMRDLAATLLRAFDDSTVVVDGESELPRQKTAL
jgi:hypothetical protein